MNDKQFDCFMQAATVLNFHRAAKDLFISQPTITYQILSLGPRPFATATPFSSWWKISRPPTPAPR